MFDMPPEKVGKITEIIGVENPETGEKRPILHLTTELLKVPNTGRRKGKVGSDESYTQGYDNIKWSQN